MKFKKENGGMPWVHMAQDRDKWLAADVNTMMNLGVSYTVGIFLTSWPAVSSSRRNLLQTVSSPMLSEF